MMDEPYSHLLNFRLLLLFFIIGTPSKYHRLLWTCFVNCPWSKWIVSAICFWINHSTRILSKTTQALKLVRPLSYSAPIYILRSSYWNDMTQLCSMTVLYSVDFKTAAHDCIFCKIISVSRQTHSWLER